MYSRSATGMSAGAAFVPCFIPIPAKQDSFLAGSVLSCLLAELTNDQKEKGKR